MSHVLLKLVKVGHWDNYSGHTLSCFWNFHYFLVAKSTKSLQIVFPPFFLKL